MNRICLLVGVFVWTAGPAFGQAPPRPMRPPVPVVAPVPPVASTAIAVPPIGGVLADPVYVPVVQQLDIEAVKQSIKAQEKQIAEEASEHAKEMAEQAKEHAFELQQNAFADMKERMFELNERSFELKNFAYAQGPVVVRGRGNGDYDGALNDLDDVRTIARSAASIRSLRKRARMPMAPSTGRCTPSKARQLGRRARDNC